MAGPNLELFKFSIYLFFPLAIMVHYGDPQWYHDNVLPIRDRFWPDEGTTYVSMN
jgi:protein PET100, fungi type